MDEWEKLAWMQQGKCHGMDPDLWFPERGQPTEPAKAVCRTCPVQQRCLDYALDVGETWGIWGGKSARERRQIKSLRRRERLAKLPVTNPETRSSLAS